MPTKVLFSEKAFRTGDEVCMPMTTWTGFKAVNPEKKDAYSQTFAITLTTPDKQVTRYSMSQPKCGDKHVALAWQIPTTGRKEEANLKIIQVKETAACLPMSSSGFCSVHFPVIVASKNIADQEAWVLYDPHMKDKKDQPKRIREIPIDFDDSISTTPTPKKRKKTPNDNK